MHACVSTCMRACVCAHTRVHMHAHRGHFGGAPEKRGLHSAEDRWRRGAGALPLQHQHQHRRCAGAQERPQRRRPAPRRAQTPGLTTAQTPRASRLAARSGAQGRRNPQIWTGWFLMLSCTFFATSSPGVLDARSRGTECLCPPSGSQWVGVGRG